MRYMFATHPQMAKEWADKTPDINHLPEKVAMEKKHEADMKKKKTKRYT